MPPEGDDPAPVPELASDEVLPLEFKPEDAIQLPALVLLEPIPVVPPPSNGEPVDMPEPLGIPGSEAPELQLGDIAGLRPPGSISVAPRPMTAPLDPLDVVDPLEPGMPSGEVVAIPKVLVELCAKAVQQLNSSAAISVGNSRITDLPYSSFRPAPERTSSE
jgi:hypothetical protein